MTGKTGAPNDYADNWDAIDWHQVEADVLRLQMRIAKAYREKKYGKVKALQWLLTHSLSAKLLAVKRITGNKGAKTPGVDKIVWRSSKQKLLAAHSLKRNGYKPLPLRRILIPKKQRGQFRPLSIPVMHCRALQALHLLGLEPIAETISNPNAYGFRPKRCFLILRQKGSAQYVFEADIKSCFDNISHTWMLNNVPMDKAILKKWLNAGYVYEGKLQSTDSGTPQGGIISPCLLNIVLSGLEDAVLKTLTAKSKNREDKMYCSIYADDFIISGATREILENKVKPAVEDFLNDRGLSLSKEKTKITFINDGFDFLGSNIRKFNGKLIIKPSKESIKTFLADIRQTIKDNKTIKAENLIRLLNPKIIGWTNFHKPNCSKKAFAYVDSKIFECLWSWAKRRHSQKSKTWVKGKYFRTNGGDNWVFSQRIWQEKRAKHIFIDLKKACSVPIKRHIKVKAEANPYHHRFVEYFEQRMKWKKIQQQFINKPGVIL